MNTFKKYCPNVWVAECEEEYEKGEIIQIETRRGKTVDCEVYNLLGDTKTEDNVKYLYSIVRLEDISYAERKAEKYMNAGINSQKKQNEYFEKAQEGREFLMMGEPIKVGHHSEKRHRALIERNMNRIEKGVELNEKIQEQQRKAKYWANKSKEITLAMPESLGFFKSELGEAEKYHKGLKNGSIEKKHHYSVAYANNAVKDLKKKVEIAEILWGNKNEL